MVVVVGRGDGEKAKGPPTKRDRLPETKQALSLARSTSNSISTPHLASQHFKSPTSHFLLLKRTGELSRHDSSCSTSREQSRWPQHASFAHLDRTYETEAPALGVILVSQCGQGHPRAPTGV